MIENKNYFVQKQTLTTISKEYKTIFSLNINEAIANIQNLSDRGIFKQRLSEKDVFLFTLFFTTGFLFVCCSIMEKKRHLV